jgi:hypothetical protein
LVPHKDRFSSGIPALADYVILYSFYLKQRNLALNVTSNSGVGYMQTFSKIFPLKNAYFKGFASFLTFFKDHANFFKN